MPGALHPLQVLPEQEDTKGLQDAPSERAGRDRPFVCPRDRERRAGPSDRVRAVRVALPESAADWPYGAESVVERLAVSPATAQDLRMSELRRRLAAR